MNTVQELQQYSACRGVMIILYSITVIYFHFALGDVLEPKFIQIVFG